MTGKEIREEVDNYLIKTREERKNVGLAKVPEFDERDIKQAYRDGMQSGLWHHSYDYLVKTADLKKRYEKQKEINKELVDENEKLKEQLESERDLPAIAYMQGAEKQKKKDTEHLTKAKEIIKNIIRVTWGEGWNYSLDWKVKAEQFLNNEVKK